MATQDADFDFNFESKVDGAGTDISDPLLLKILGKKWCQNLIEKYFSTEITLKKSPDDPHKKEVMFLGDGAEEKRCREALTNLQELMQSTREDDWPEEYIERLFQEGTLTSSTSISAIRKRAKKIAQELDSAESPAASTKEKFRTKAKKSDIQRKRARQDKASRMGY